MLETDGFNGDAGADRGIWFGFNVDGYGPVSPDSVLTTLGGRNDAEPTISTLVSDTPLLVLVKPLLVLVKLVLTIAAMPTVTAPHTATAQREYVHVESAT